jgi:hypothetical protein
MAQAHPARARSQVLPRGSPRTHPVWVSAGQRHRRAEVPQATQPVRHRAERARAPHPEYQTHLHWERGARCRHHSHTSE